MLGCTTYVLRRPRRTKLERRAWEEVYLVTLNHNVYRLLIKETGGNFWIFELRQVTFDEWKCSDAEELPDLMEEYDSGDESCGHESNSEHSSAVQSNTSGDSTFTSESLHDYTDNSFRSISESPLQHISDRKEDARWKKNICNDTIDFSMMMNWITMNLNRLMVIMNPIIPYPRTCWSLLPDHQSRVMITLIVIRAVCEGSQSGTWSLLHMALCGIVEHRMTSLYLEPWTHHPWRKFLNRCNWRWI